MKNRRTLLMIVSFIMALLLAMSIYGYLKSLETKSAQSKQFDIMVASAEIPPYTKITAEMVTQSHALQLPADSASYYSKPEEVIGKYSADKILKGEQFFKSRVIEDVSNYLSLKLTGSNRAVSVTASLESGVTKLIKAGDSIDILVFMPEIKESNRIIRPDIEKLVLQNVQVLAVDKVTTTTSSAPPSSSKDAPKESDSSGGGAQGMFNLTLSIPVFDVEKLALAEDIGNLKFALRPKDDPYIYPTNGAIWQELLLDDSKRMKDINPTYQIKPDKKANAAYNYDKYVYYVVKKGDTLRKIAEVQLKDPNKYTILQDINNIPDPNFILPGTGLKIPVIK